MATPKPAKPAAAAKPTGELNAARLETTDMLRQLQRKVAGTAGAKEAEQREVTVRRRQQEYTVTQQLSSTPNGRNTAWFDVDPCPFCAKCDEKTPCNERKARRKAAIGAARRTTKAKTASAFLCDDKAHHAAMQIYTDMKLEHTVFAWDAEIDDHERQAGFGCPLGQGRGAQKCHYWPLTGIYAKPKIKVTWLSKIKERKEEELDESTENQLMGMEEREARELLSLKPFFEEEEPAEDAQYHSCDDSDAGPDDTGADSARALYVPTAGGTSNAGGASSLSSNPSAHQAHVDALMAKYPWAHRPAVAAMVAKEAEHAMSGSSSSSEVFDLGNGMEVMWVGNAGGVAVDDDHEHAPSNSEDVKMEEENDDEGEEKRGGSADAVGFTKYPQPYDHAADQMELMWGGPLPMAVDDDHEFLFF